MKFEKNREEDPKGDEEKEKGEEGKGPTSPCTALPPRWCAGRPAELWARRRSKALRAGAEGALSHGRMRALARGPAAALYLSSGHGR